MLPRATLAALSLVLAGCLQANSSGTGVVDNQQGCGAHCGKGSVGGRGGTSAGTPSTSTSGGSLTSGTTAPGTASSGGSTSGGSSGATTTYATASGQAICPGLATGQPTSCSDGGAFSSQLLDITCSTVQGASISAVGAEGIPFSGAATTTAVDGTFSLCLPAATPFSVQISGATYPTTYYAELLNADAGYVEQMGAISTAELQAFATFLPSGYDPTKALIVVKLAGTHCLHEYAGWSFTVTLPDGGAPPDGGLQVVYLGATGIPDPTATATAKNGAGLIDGIDPAISSFYVVTVSNPNPDAGNCVPLNGSVGFTGRVFVSEGSVAIDPIIFP